ncbi:hypothetical protein COB64_02055 [Candidatus Wolfebacteria bacterium]|nr:MAG: hypothetical protein COB64_02055 [Candidatus Wolfebacteria bacterium]
MNNKTNKTTHKSTLGKKFAILVFAVVFIFGFFSPVSVSIHPTSLTPTVHTNVAYATHTGEFDDTDPAKDENVLPACDLFGEDTQGGVMGCIAQVIYYILFVPTAFILALIGKFLDFTLAYTLDSASYTGTSFITEGWKITRDISNILFIFILVFVAIKTILGIAGADTKRTIANVVVVALLINFSLFFTKVVVDSSNIVARIFYNAIEVTGPAEFVKVSGAKSISIAVISKFEPQKLFAQVASGPNIERVSNDPTSSILTARGLSRDAYASFFSLVSLLAAGINIVAIWVFFTVAILFIARTLGLWIVMISAPFAFISYAIPQIGDFQQKWWGNLLKLSFLAPVFIFFLFLIVMFLETDIIGSAFGKGENLSTVQAVLNIVFPLSIIAMLLIMAKKLAENLAGEAGKVVTAAAKKVGAVGGAALGAAAGVGGLALRSTAGLAAAGAAESKGLQQAAAEGQFGARTKLRLANYLRGASFDIRQAPGVSEAAGAGGINLDNRVLQGVGLGAAAGVGGYEGRVEERRKERMDLFEQIKMKGLEAARQDQNARNWEKAYGDMRDDAREETEGKGQIFNEKEFKDAYTKGEPLTVKGEAITGSPEVSTSKKINEQRQTDYANTLEAGTSQVLLKNLGVISKVSPTGPAAAFAAQGDLRAALELRKGLATDKVESYKKAIKKLDNDIEDIDIDVKEGNKILTKIKTNAALRNNIKPEELHTLTRAQIKEQINYDVSEKQTRLTELNNQLQTIEVAYKNTGDERDKQKMTETRVEILRAEQEIKGMETIIDTQEKLEEKIEKKKDQKEKLQEKIGSAKKSGDSAKK